jgi:diguanylate cyclase (GGDEF)-like protein
MATGVQGRKVLAVVAARSPLRASRLMDRTRFPRSLSDDARPVLVCVALLVSITVLRLVVSNPIEAVGFLFVIPVGMLASECGVAAGVAAAAGAVACTVFWAVAQDVPLGVMGYGARVGTFVAIGVIVGLQAQKRLRLEGERERLIAELRATALRDQLTGLPNRRAWHDRFDQELALAERSGRALSVAMLDLDRLKQVNDTHGHEEGDRLIRRCAHAWAGVLRRSDFLARFGGDEFVAVLPDCTRSGAEELAQRMLDAVPSEQTCSIGIAVWDRGEAGYELVHRADQAMYAVKGDGGGSIGVAPEPDRISAGGDADAASA